MLTEDGVMTDIRAAKLFVVLVAIVMLTVACSYSAEPVGDATDLTTAQQKESAGETVEPLSESEPRSVEEFLTIGDWPSTPGGLLFRSEDAVLIWSEGEIFKVLETSQLYTHECWSTCTEHFDGLSWSPDGLKIAFTEAHFFDLNGDPVDCGQTAGLYGWLAGGPCGQIFVASAENPEPQQISRVRLPSWTYLDGATEWSPSGDYVVFFSQTCTTNNCHWEPKGDRVSHAHIAAADGSAYQQLSSGVWGGDWVLGIGNLAVGNQPGYWSEPGDHYYVRVEDDTCPAWVPLGIDSSEFQDSASENASERCHYPGEVINEKGCYRTNDLRLSCSGFLDDWVMVSPNGQLAAVHRSYCDTPKCTRDEGAAPSYLLEPRPCERSSLLLLPTGEGSARRLADVGADRFDSWKDQLYWSPDSTRLAVVTSEMWSSGSAGDGCGKSWGIEKDLPVGEALYVVSADGTNIRVIDRFEEERYPWEVWWSPDSTKLAYAKHCYYGCGVRGDEAFVAHADGSQITRIAEQIEDKARVREMLWSPDGSQIAYQIWSSENAVIYLENADGSEPPEPIYVGDSIELEEWR